MYRSLYSLENAPVIAPFPNFPPKANGGLKNRRLARRLQEIEKLPKRDQQALLRTIEAFISKAG